MDNQSQSTNTSQRILSPKLIVIGLIVLIIIVAIILFLILRQRNQTTQPGPLPTEVVVELTDDGFVPPEVRIQSGSAVRWVNKASDEQVSVNSDDHPENKKFPELDLGIIPANSSVVHIFNNPGEYTYHDYFQPERRGTVIVE